MGKTYVNLSVRIGISKIVLNDSKIYVIDKLDETRQYIVEKLIGSYKNKEVEVLYTKWIESSDKKTDIKTESHLFIMKVKNFIEESKSLNNFPGMTDKDNEIDKDVAEKIVKKAKKLKK